MTAQNKPQSPPETSDQSAASTRNPVLVERIGRGRLGGSRKLDLLAQRARHYGRRVKILDGDLRSRTLASLYPAKTEAGELIVDGASVPPSEEQPAMHGWIFDELDQMVVDRVSRVLDLGGGDRVMQEFVRQLPVASFCRQFGIDLLSLYMLGPDPEDFRHVLELIRSGGSERARKLLVLNEGVIRQGQSVESVFEPLTRLPDFRALMKDGARVTFFRRLTCMDQVQASGLSYYDIAAGKPGADGVRPRATMQHMVKVWLQQFEAEQESAGTLEWLP